MPCRFRNHRDCLRKLMIFETILILQADGEEKNETNHQIKSEGWNLAGSFAFKIT